MKNIKSFSGRPFSILFIAASLLLIQPVFGQSETPVRYGNGGFAPTDLSAGASSRGDDMTGGVVASPVMDGATANSYQANVESRLNNLESEMRDLRGQLEEKDHQITQLKTQLDKSLADLEMRVGSGAPPADTPATGTGNLQSGDMNDMSSPPQPNADPNAPASADSPTAKNLGTLSEAPGGVPIAPGSNDVAARYESAFTKLKNGDYQNAQAEFRKFLDAYPDHQLASNATYWYGETFYAQQKFSESARIFAESYKKYPKSAKAADSLLKLGMSLGGAGKTKEACVTLKQIRKQYPSGSSTLLKRADAEMSKLACS